MTPWTRQDGEWTVNEHRRRLDDTRLEGLFARLLDPAAHAWPADVWPPLVLDDGLNVGSDGGHGPIRYRVTDAQPGRIRFSFTGDLDGWHEFRIEGVEVVHELRIRRPSLIVRLVVVHLHDALIEHLLDDLEHGGDGYPRRKWPRGSHWRYMLTTRGMTSLRRRRTSLGTLDGGTLPYADGPSGS